MTTRRFPPPWSVEETDGGLLVTDVDPAAVSRAPYPAGSVASTAAPQPPQPPIKPPSNRPTPTPQPQPPQPLQPRAAQPPPPQPPIWQPQPPPASAAAAPSAASPCKPYAGAKFSFFVENVKGRQAHIKHFLLGEKNSLPRILRRNVCCRRVCRCAARYRQRNPGSRPHG